jgi:hypothetical protein
LPCRPGTWAVHLPVTSAAKAVDTSRQASTHKDAKSTNVLMQAMMELEIKMLPSGPKNTPPEAKVAAFTKLYGSAT